MKALVIIVVAWRKIFFWLVDILLLEIYDACVSRGAPGDIESIASHAADPEDMPAARCVFTECIREESGAVFRSHSKPFL
jgi:hypothetical protein